MMEVAKGHVTDDDPAHNQACVKRCIAQQVLKAGRTVKSYPFDTSSYLLLHFHTEISASISK